MGQNKEIEVKIGYVNLCINAMVMEPDMILVQGFCRITPDGVVSCVVNKMILVGMVHYFKAIGNYHFPN